MEISNLEYQVALTQIIITDTLSKLDLIPEILPEVQAKKIYGDKQIEAWRNSDLIVGYPTGNKTRNTIYFKRSECERAKLMVVGSTQPDKDNKINQIIEFIHSQIKHNANPINRINVR